MDIYEAKCQWYAFTVHGAIAGIPETAQTLAGQ
jgi:hypothetical protein